MTWTPAPQPEPDIPAITDTGSFTRPPTERERRILEAMRQSAETPDRPRRYGKRTFSKNKKVDGDK